MCLFPRFIKNKRFQPTKKNGYNAPPCTDERMRTVPIGCGNCIECRKQMARAWQVRLYEELKANKGRKQCYFVTLSFSPESLRELTKTYKLQECNAVATIATRKFLERWRKKYKQSLRHWFITELGDLYTERIHIHGLIWTNETTETIEKIWKYGNIWCGEYCTLQTINYIVKYMTKIDPQHKTYKPIILCSPKIGAQYTKTSEYNLHKYKPLNTQDYYRLPNGTKVNNPIYYRNKLYTEEEREKLWIERLDRNEIYVMGQKFEINTEQKYNKYLQVLKQAQRTNLNIGYGSTDAEWKEETYNITVKMLQKQGKLQKKL